MWKRLDVIDKMVRIADHGLDGGADVLCLLYDVRSRLYQWYKWYKNIVQWLSNSTIGKPMVRADMDGLCDH